MTEFTFQVTSPHGCPRYRRQQYGMPRRELRHPCACAGRPRARTVVGHPTQPPKELPHEDVRHRTRDPRRAQPHHEELRGITSTSNEAVASLEKPYTWLHSYVAGDKVYCFHQAENAEIIREHARRGGFPANLVAEVPTVFDSTGPRGLPV